MHKETKSARYARCYAEWQESLKQLQEKAEKVTEIFKEQLEADAEQLEPFDDGDVIEWCMGKRRRLRFLREITLNNFNQSDSTGTVRGTANSPCKDPFIKHFNLFVDLDMLSEDVTEFEVEDTRVHDDVPITGEWSQDDPDNVFRLEQETDILLIRKDRLLALANLLRQVDATKKRKGI